MIEEMWVDAGPGRIFVKIWSISTLRATGTPPIVLFHDSLGSVELWRDFPERLSVATRRDVIAYDRLGWGRSDPYPGILSRGFIREEASGSFRALRNHLGLESFIAFGHSVGGGMAVICAGAFPSDCRALITESAQAFVEDRTIEGIVDAKQAFDQEAQFDRLRKYHGDKARWVLDSWTETWLSPEFADWRLDDDLPRVSCPLLAIHGDNDEYGSVCHPRRIAAGTSGSAVVRILADCGHVPHREKQQTVIDAVTAFLDSVAASAS